MSRYATFPTEYPLELCASGKRDKARAYLEYCLDLESNTQNAGSFYANGWGISKKTANIWIHDFKEAIEIHHKFWLEKNTQNANRIFNNSQKTGCRQGAGDVPVKSSTGTSSTEFEKSQCAGNVPARKPSINNKQYTSSSEEEKTPKKTHVTDGLFNARFAELRMSTNKFLGSKEKSYESYLRVSNMFDIRVLAYCYKQYFKSFDDANAEQTVGFAKFLDNDLHLSYLPKRFKLKTADNELVGELKDEVFTSDDGRLFELTNKRFLEKLEAKEIMFEGVA